MTHDGLRREWQILQGNSERYETGALAIKLVAVALVVACFAVNAPMVLTLALLAVLWLQEGIFRTSQSRLADRLLRIEAKLDAGGDEQDAFRLHLEWHASRPGMAGLIAEYLANAMRPTVAYPYPLLMIVVALGAALPAVR
ncbi:MAG: hypothetical protein U1F52_14490 [Burkholderiales bacterium]